MDLRYSPSEQKFQADLRAWLAEAVPAHGQTPAQDDWAARREYDTGWQRKLFDAGYAGINWPQGVRRAAGPPSPRSWSTTRRSPAPTPPTSA